MPYQFCYWDAKATVDIIIILINQAITLALLIFTLRRAAIIKRLYTNNIQINFKPIIVIHILILLWCLSKLTFKKVSWPSISTQSSYTIDWKMRWKMTKWLLTHLTMPFSYRSLHTLYKPWSSLSAIFSRSFLTKLQKSCAIDRYKKLPNLFE